MTSTLETIGKPVISLTSGKQLGIVCNIEIKRQKITRLVILSDEIDQIEYIFVPVQNIYSLGSEAITLKSHLRITENTESPCPKILGVSVITQKGEKVFAVQDIFFDEKTFKIIHLTCFENKTHNPDIIATIEDGYIVLKGNIKAVGPRKKTSQAKAPVEESLTPDEPVLKINPQSLMPSDEDIEKTIPQVPSKIIGDYNFLIGRDLAKSLAYKNRILIEAGEKLTADKLRLAINTGNLNFILKNTLPV